MTNQRLTTIALLGLLSAISVPAQADDELIARAVLPLPESMRADASVFTYDAAGTRQTLREGSNAVECKIKDEKEHT